MLRSPWLHPIEQSIGSWRDYVDEDEVMWQYKKPEDGEEGLGLVLL